MRFEKWEEEAFNYLTKLYDNFLKNYLVNVWNALELIQKNYFRKMLKN